MSILTCRDVSFSYDGSTVLSNINFEVGQGDYLCVVGENGAGKSTLMKGILGLKKASTGQILTGDDLKQNEIGYLPQQDNVQRDFPASVNEVVLSGRLNALGKRFFYGKEDKSAVKSAMEQVGIWEFRNRCYRELSGGQQQRVLLARALCSTKRLLMLDEPVTGLDPIIAGEMYSLIETINKERNIAVIMISHDVKGAIPYASHVLHLGSEQLFFGTRDEYLETELGKAFAGTSMMGGAQ